MIVAPRTLNRQAEYPPAERGNEIVEVLVPPLRVVFFTKMHSGAGAQETRSYAGLVGRPVDFVPSDLLLDEPVEGLILIKRGNDVVAVPPGVGSVVVLLEAVRVRVARDVEPVATPTLPVVRGSKQPLDQALPRVGA